MATNEIPPEALQVAARFYKAVDSIVAKGRIRGLATIAREWGASRFALSWSKHHPEQKRIKVEYLYYIARDYGVSLDWLFFGSGKMFKQ